MCPAGWCALNEEKIIKFLLLTSVLLEDADAFSSLNFLVAMDLSLLMLMC